MTPKGIFARVRMEPAVNDVNKTKFSDYQLLNALNTVISIIYNAVSTSSSGILNQTIDLKVRKNKTELPENFLSMVNIYDDAGNVLYPATKSEDISQNNYRIVGTTLFTGAESVTIEYKPLFEEITYDDLEDDLSLPEIFRDMVRTYMVLRLTNDASANEQLAGISESVYRILADRDYNMIVASRSANELAWKV